MLTAIVLVCSLASVCTPDNARQVVRLPETFSSPVTCFMHGQAYFAGTSLAKDLGAGEIVRVICR